MSDKLNLRYDSNAIARFEEVSGLDWFDRETFRRVFKSVRLTRAIVWVGLLHEQPALTLEDAGKLLKLSQISDIDGQVSAALKEACGD